MRFENGTTAEAELVVRADVGEAVSCTINATHNERGEMRGP